MSNFSSQEIILIEEFRKRVADVLPIDEYSKRDDNLIRWIRARDMDLGKAEEMLRNSLKWREENGINSILDQGLDSDMVEKFPYYLDGFDKLGRPVVTLPYGKWDARSFIEAEGPTRFVRYSNQYLESLFIAIKKATAELDKDGKQDTCVQYTLISDMAGFTFHQIVNFKAIQSLIQTLGVLEAHYPETMAQCIVINVPAVFCMLFAMMKPFMSSRTIDKFKIFPEDKEKWLPVIEAIIEPSQIRKQFGGTKT